MSGPLLAIVDYGIGNLRSAEKGLQRVGADARLTADPGLIAAADGVVLPGVGAFGRCLEALRASGLEDAVVGAAGSGRPFLGICIGMQMLYERSEEDPSARGLGVLPGWVRRLPAGVKHPQMQWNTLQVQRPSPVFDAMGAEPWVYFVHSFAADGPSGDDVAATCDYGGPVVAAVQRGSLVATQFHPEKSGRAGLAFLGGFVALATASAAGSAAR